MRTGKLIIFEGISGTGKETQAKLLQQYLLTRKIKAEIVFHPSPELKIILSKWHRERQIDHIAEVYLFLADRYSRVKQLIQPKLAKGYWVISLRNYLSALVYQGKTEKERLWINREFSRFEPQPDYLFYFDMTANEAMTRIQKRHVTTGEILGKFEDLNLLKQKRQAYLKILNNSHISKNMNLIRINADQTIEQIHGQIVKNLSL